MIECIFGHVIHLCESYEPIMSHDSHTTTIFLFVTRMLDVSLPCHMKIT